MDISKESQAALDRGDRQRATGAYEPPQGTKKPLDRTHYPYIVDDIISYESGEMSDDQIVAFFQRLVDSGMAWQLQGSYGRMAQSLIASGMVTRKGDVVENIALGAEGFADNMDAGD